jgi:GNAT superfamily N-acetyltransferase
VAPDARRLEAAEIAGWVDLFRAAPRRLASRWLAMADGEPAAAGTLFVLGDCAWVALGSTLPAYRGRGAQSTLVAERIRAAEGLGCLLVLTETGAVEHGRPSGSYRNILRAGFERAYVRGNLAAPGVAG